MSAVSNYSATSISDVLSRFEKEALETASRADLVKLFCIQVIPFLSNHPLLGPLRARWISRRQELAYSVLQHERNTLDELKSTFAKVKKDLQASTDAAIQSQIAKIEHILRGKDKYYSPPIYVVVFDELKQLLEFALKAGHIDICKKYSTIQTHQKVIQKDPGQKMRWGLLNEEGYVYKILSTEELAKAQDDPSLISIPPETHVVDETFIESFTLAPSLEKTYESKRARQSDQIKDPAVVWEWMESALYYWNTPVSYFDQTVSSPKTQSDCTKHFKRLCEASAWREIEDAKQNNPPRSRPFIFTDKFFRLGIRTLINEVTAFLSLPNIPPLNEALPSSCLFELLLEGQELWIGATLDDGKKERYYLQKFHDGEHPDGSSPLRFVKKLLQNPRGGEIEIELRYKSESVGKYINCLKMPKDLKRFFFDTSHGSYVQFKGSKIELVSDSQCNTDTVLKELRENHQKSKM